QQSPPDSRAPTVGTSLLHPVSILDLPMQAINNSVHPLALTTCIGSTSADSTTNSGFLTTATTTTGENKEKHDCKHGDIEELDLRNFKIQEVSQLTAPKVVVRQHKPRL
ncbi:hypothetical protein BGX29_004219, partial [Mortierella sp. GBA35]